MKELKKRPKKQLRTFQEPSSIEHWSIRDKNVRENFRSPRELNENDRSESRKKSGNIFKWIGFATGGRIKRFSIRGQREGILSEGWRVRFQDFQVHWKEFEILKIRKFLIFLKRQKCVRDGALLIIKAAN